MKRSFDDVKQRQMDILDYLRDHGQSSVKATALAFNVSELTIRRDFQKMANMGQIIRNHGGACLDDSMIADGVNIEIERIKHAIAQKAATYIEHHQTIFLNTSSTALLSLNYLTDTDLTVVTNNVKAAYINNSHKFTLVLSGGEIRYPKESMIGDIAIDSISKVTSDITIIGCSGISASGGITTEVFHEAKINSLMIERSAGLVIVVADYRKIGQISNFISSPIQKVHILITDQYADETSLKEITKSGVMVIQI